MVAAQVKRERRGRPTQAEAVEKRHAIIAAAAALFLSLGYKDVSVRRIADAADVSTRTVFNLFEDKASLFKACLESISLEPTGPLQFDGMPLVDALEAFAVRMLDTMSSAEGLGFARLVMSDGRDFPELAAAGNANQDRQFVQPLAELLRDHAASPEEAAELAKTFIAMAISDWNRSVIFHLPMPDAEESMRHAHKVAQIFANGIEADSQRNF